MTWKLIAKDINRQPLGDDYHLWKEQIADECFHQCVYCSIHENPWGGIDHYHIDHFRPKSVFKDLENNICNLFYACPVCNRFKSDDWPGEPDNLNKICYPDPSKTDYSSLFNLDNSDYTIQGNCTSAKYLINRLFLNRPQLIYERRETFLKEKECNLTKEISSILNEHKNILDKGIIIDFINITQEIRQHLQDREKIRPYKLAEIKKN